MDKLNSDLKEAETRLKYIEEQCEYFQKQAWIERSKIRELHKELHKPSNSTSFKTRCGIIAESKNPEDLPKLVEGLKCLSKQDIISKPKSQVTTGCVEFMDDCVFTGPLGWPSDVLINIVPQRTVYICNICFDEIGQWRWTDGLNFDICERCYQMSINKNILNMKNSKGVYVVSDLEKVMVN